tara:strand:- start:32754 stop:33722 length:969 start_codon:yes stop_codon:yes gene_type:complete
MTHSSRVVRVDSHLGDPNWVGKLTLEYHVGKESFTKVIPFYENPTILESQNPRYMNYAVVGRSSNLFGYLGADSRKFNLSFKITLPNVASVMQQYDQLWTTPPTKQQKQMEILQESMSEKLAEDPGADISADIGKQEANWEFLDESARHYAGVAKELDNQYLSEEVLLESELNLNKKLAYDSPMYNVSGEGVGLRRALVNKISSFIASIRSTVVNNAVSPQYGPPLVRLDWGILYRDVPCVCKGYTINVNDKGGYDKKTLLPRVLDITMSLEEARNLGGKASSVQSDDLRGWEVLLGTEATPGLNTDPGNFKNWKASSTWVR